MSNRLYYAESFRTSFEAHVSDIRQISRTQGQTLWQIALDLTAFYPTSGGQPHDTGVLEATAPSGAILQAQVLAVEEDEAGEVWHTTVKPLPAGTAVQGRIDWNRRLDHMQQHSGQHLLSAIFQRETGASTVSFHLGETVSTIDLAVESLTSQQLDLVEDAANQIVAEDRAVTGRSVEREEAEALLRAGVLRKLPGRGGPIRLIEIVDLDLNACGGTHVRSTGQIGGLMIRSTERAKQGLRVEFVCGLRAIHSVRGDLRTLNRASSALSVGHSSLPESIERLLKENKAISKERQRLREELARYHTDRLLAEFPIENGRRLVLRSFFDQDAAYVKLLASRLTGTTPRACALLASTAQEPASIVMAASKDLDIDCGALLREALASLGARGGGTSEIAQGQVPSAQLEVLLRALETNLAKDRSGVRS